jgi:hypothetical protein
MKKIVREYIVNEKFTSDSDPIKDLGIGLYAHRNFENLDKIADFLIQNMSGILHTSKIPKDIIEDSFYLFKKKYIATIDEYIESYIKLNGEIMDSHTDYNLFEIMMKKLIKLGYKHR